MKTSEYISLDEEKTKDDENTENVSHLQPPYSQAGMFSLIFVNWIRDLLNKIDKGKFDDDRDLWACAVRDKSDINSISLERLWKEDLIAYGEENSRIWRVIWNYGKKTFISLTIASILNSMFAFISSSFCVDYLLQYADGDLDGLGVGLVLLFSMGFTVLARLLITAYMMLLAIFLGTRLRNGIMAMLYKKCLKVKDLSDDTIGKLINTISTDGERIQRGIPQGLPMLSTPLLLVGGTVYSCLIVGPMALVATAIFIGQLFTVVMLAKKMGGMRKQAAGIADTRLKAISELLTCIKIIKVYAWENSFMERIFATRELERVKLFGMRVIQSLMLMSSAYALAFSQVVTIVVAILVLGKVTPVEAFTLIALLNTMKIALDIIPSSLRALADIMVSLKRIKEVMLMEEFDPPNQMDDEDEKMRYCVTFDQSTFAYRTKSNVEVQEPNGNIAKGVNSKLTKERKTGYGTLHKPSSEKGQLLAHSVSFVDLPSLINLNFGIRKGKLIGICGNIGSGKSSFLQAILGRVELICGKFAINGDLAYVAQEAWLNNATVKENILFGNTLDANRYEKCLDVCCLKDDLNILMAGDQTEVGERGINLSGGQKQRISLARAVYSDRDVYLLDDPLSAVDNRVAARIFSECIQGALSDKSVLLVTHQVRFLSRCDEVIYMKDTGMMANYTHDDLMKIDPQYKEMIESVDLEDKDGNNKGSETAKTEKKPDDKKISESATGKMAGKLTGKELSVSGDLKWSTIAAYFRASGGMFTGIVLIMFIGMNVASQAFPAWWISYWLEKDFPSADPNCTHTCDTIDIRDDPDFLANLLTYAASPFIILVTGIIAAVIVAKITYAASTNFHNALVKKVSLATMSFFDTTPIGQVQNRFTSDMDQMDSFLSTNMEMLVYYALLIFIIIVTVIVSSPLVTAVVVPAIVIFYIVWRKSRPAVRDLKRVENVARSPQYSMVTSTVKGLTTVASFGKTGDFCERFCGILDRFHVRLVCFQFVSRWMAIRLDIIVWSIVVAISVVIVAVPAKQAASESGLALTFALQLSTILYILVLFTNELIASFTSVERVDEYLKNIPEEAPAIIESTRPEPSWPPYGQILFYDFSMRYQPHLPRVLDQLNFRVDPMEKVGIVGRTGAGKSSIATALFRLVEKDSGSIYIDGLDISTIGLRDLRERISLVPQDPVLFAGSIRTNVDPFHERTDSEIWEALSRVNMKSKILNMHGGLEQMVSDGGSNFSLGERQLICMARAILNRSRILLMDEATASVDPQTDALIQRAIRTSFPDCTMLIIAHRLNTVLDCDKILVLDKGKVAEYDSPENLLANPNSIFKQLLASSMK